jgi:dienelactone hydrolase
MTMPRFLTFAAAAVLLSASCAGAPEAPSAAPIATAAPVAVKVTPAGDWHALLSVPPGATYRLGIHIDETSPGVFTGTIASPDLGRSGTPLEELVFADGVLKFKAPSRTAFEGRWDPAAKAWSGTYTLATGSFPLTFAGGAVPPLPPLPAVAGLDGRWEGKLQGMMTLVIRVITDETGTRVMMDSPNQLATNTPVPSFSRDGSKVTFAIPNIRASYSGDLSPAGDKITGAFTQGASLPLDFTRVSADTAPTVVRERSQTPKKPYPYREEQVSIDNPASSGLRLACTLTTPQDAGPHSAAILITGSGAQDRDETLLGHKPFLVLADYLTRQGIAVLRCDDRDLTRPTTVVMGSLISDFVTDVKAELAFMRGRSDIDSRRIGLIGHSEGGVTGPRVAADDPDIAFLVMMAGLGATGKEVLLEQRRLLVQSMGGGPEEVQQAGAMFGGMFDAMLAAPDAAAAKAAAVKAMSSARTAPGSPPLTEKVIDDAASQFASAYYRDLLAYDPAPVFAKINAPILAINGSKDVQVAAKQNLDGLRRLTAANKDVTLVELPGLNHLFQTSTTGAVSEYGDIDETFAPVALTTISDWIVKRMQR